MSSRRPHTAGWDVGERPAVPMPYITLPPYQPVHSHQRHEDGGFSSTRVGKNSERARVAAAPAAAAAAGGVPQVRHARAPRPPAAPGQRLGVQAALGHARLPHRRRARIKTGGARPPLEAGDAATAADDRRRRGQPSGGGRGRDEAGVPARGRARGARRRQAVLHGVLQGAGAAQEHDAARERERADGRPRHLRVQPEHPPDAVPAHVEVGVRGRRRGDDHSGRPTLLSRRLLRRRLRHLRLDVRDLRDAHAPARPGAPRHRARGDRVR